ncbi:hypothetical protein [Nakamurella lactea]|uniref:hypothetical protein n=1 Tax=Nakamurella lactea TaxID=459515 RepID=UPI000401D28E|nr:hypothetical protein [Nakamurella lactea]
MTDYYISRDQECIVVELEDTCNHRDAGVSLTTTEWEAFVAEGDAIRDAIESGADDPDVLGDLIRDGA